MTPTADLIEAYLTHLRMLSRSPRTIDARRYILSRADTELPYGLDQANHDELAAWIYQDHWSAQTKSTFRAAVRSFYQFCAGRYLDDDPSADLPAPRVPRGVPRPVTDDELARLLAASTEPIRLWALIAAYEGARCIEISRLTRADITEQVTYLDGKGDKPRAVPTHPDVWAAVRDLPDGPIAVVDGHPATPRQISTRAAVYWSQTLGMRGVSMHRLRHWFLTQAHRVTRDIRVTQQLAGHASPGSTAIYTQVADVDMQTAVMALPRLSISAPSPVAGVAESSGTAPGPALAR